MPPSRRAGFSRLLPWEPYRNITVTPLVVLEVTTGGTTKNAINQKVTEAPSEKLDATPSRYHS